MAQTAVAGVVAAGRVPTWIIPQASIATDPTPGTYSIPLTALTGGTTVKADCHMDAGDLSESGWSSVMVWADRHGIATIAP